MAVPPWVTESWPASSATGDGVSPPQQMRMHQSVESHLTEPESPLRAYLLRLLGSGRAITTSELRHRTQEAGFPAAQVESIYGHLNALERRGLVRRVGKHGGRVFWALNNLSAGAEFPLP